MLFDCGNEGVFDWVRGDGSQANAIDVNSGRYMDGSLPTINMEAANVKTTAENDVWT